MVWSNWQGAIWRGAGVMLLLWSGLAWTQTPVQPSGGNSNEPTMVVHENGRAVRCRVLETWALPDGRKAHLLESVDTGEKITIVSETMPGSGPLNPKAMPIRIFAWGKDGSASPKGAPLPPHLRLDSGVVIKNEMPQPQDAVVLAEGSGPVIINSSDDSALGGSFIEPGPRVIERTPVLRKGPHVLARFFPNRNNLRPEDGQVIDIPANTSPTPIQTIDIPSSNPVVQAQVPGSQEVIVPLNEPMPSRPGILPGKILPRLTGKPNVQQQPTYVPSNLDPLPPLAKSEMPIPPANLITPPSTTDVVVNPQPSFNPSATKPSTQNLFTPSRGPLVEKSKTVAEPSKPWQPGDRISSWWNKSTPKTETTPKVDIAKSLVPADPVVVDPKATGQDSKLKKADDYLSSENKLAEKKLQEKMEKIYKMPFSTAMNPNAPAPDLKKPRPSPLSIPGNKKDDGLPLTKVTPTSTPKEEVKQPAQEDLEPKRAMFGSGSADKVQPPGKATLDPLAVKPDLVKLPPPTARQDDPLMAPDRVPTKSKGRILPPVAHDQPAPYPNGNAWPPGAASVLAARNGLEGPVAFVPVPTVTVPAPNRPPMPPPPNMPEAPQLNANLNAFSAPPMPRGGPQMQQQQGMMPAQAMMPYGQPVPYGYPPMPAHPMNPYGQPNMMMAQGMPYQQPMMPPQSPMTNYGRQYAGPLPPQNPFAPPMMPAGYGYPPMMPQQPIQQTGYQPNPAQNAAPQQIDQLIKVMRENAYPAQREWAAQMLSNYEWRTNPQIVPALLQSATQDPAASVRAGCVTCLGRMQAAVEPVFATLHGLRNDIDPRVRSEVEQAFTRLGQTPTAPQR
ncbi:MAG TPA: HEAT repeat domain-containing protein [Gemmataceae bacterium]|nr:HEAT repeat domain-containing protein [Gemmataceae bacterium]